MGERKSKLAVIQTVQTDASVSGFIKTLDDEQKRQDSFTLIDMMSKASGHQPALWGKSIIGFGNKRYKSPQTGREVDWFLIGFSPRKANLSVYFSTGIKQHAVALEKLGKHKTGVSCLYINKLQDINQEVLSAMIRASMQQA